MDETKLPKLEKLLALETLRTFASKSLNKDEVITVLRTFIEKTRADFLAAFKEVIKLTTEIEKKLISKIDNKLSEADIEIKNAKSAVQQAKQDLQQIVKETRDANTTTLAQLRTRALESIDSLFTKMRLNDRFNTLLGQYKAKVEELNTKIADVPTTEQIIDKERISGLEDEIKSLRKEIAMKASGGVRRVYQPYVDDFSAQTNGSLKVFVLSREPLRTNTVMVFGTDFPVILRYNTDFTIVGKTLTLTSAVPAPSQGATMIAHYQA